MVTSSSKKKIVAARRLDLLNRGQLHATPGWIVSKISAAVVFHVTRWRHLMSPKSDVLWVLQQFY